jgi:hypothetical protein
MVILFLNASVIVIVVIIVLKVCCRKARVNILWDRNVLFSLLLFSARDISCLQWTIFIEGTTDEVGTVG